MRARSFLFATLGVLALALTYHLGADSAVALTPSGEVAVGSYDLLDGEQVPMPFYSDGSRAQPSECTYAVGGYDVGFAYPGQYVICGIRFAVLNAGTSPVLQAGVFNEQGRWFSAHATVSVTAVRTVLPTPTVKQSFGALKRMSR